MKFFISLFILMLFINTEASVIKIYYTDSREEALLIRDAFLREYNFKKRWFEIKKSQNDCEDKVLNEILSICINQKKELIQLFKNNKQINAFKILKKEKEND